MIKYKASDFAYKIFVQIFFILLSITIVFTLYYLIVNSMKSTIEFDANQFSPPKSLYFSNFNYVWKEGAIGITFRNSLIICCTGTLLCIFIAFISGFIFVYMTFTGRRLLTYLILSTMYISPMALMIPLYLQMTKLNLNNTYIALIIIYVALNSAFSIYLMTTYLKGIPAEIIEAAIIDGCGELGLLFRIFLPLSKSAILVLSVISFSAMWNDLLFALIFLQKEQKQTIMVAIANFRGSFGTGNMTHILSALTIATLPVLILYLFVQRSFKEGMTFGTFK